MVLDGRLDCGAGFSSYIGQRLQSNSISFHRVFPIIYLFYNNLRLIIWFFALQRSDFTPLKIVQK